LLELLRQYKYAKFLANLNTNSKSLHDISKNLEIKIIDYAKKILNRKITESDFVGTFQEIRKFFYNDYSKLTNSINTSLMQTYLGPLSYHSLRKLINIDDLKEIYIEASKTNMSDWESVHGCIKSETLGWTAWALVYGDKFMMKSLTSKHVWLTSMNHFKKGTALEELYHKMIRYKQETTQRSLKRIFISNNFWFHKDLNKLLEGISPIIFDDYSDDAGFGYNAQDD
jgi:hypothetical protein